MGLLSVFLTCHNRPVETRAVILSILDQSDKDFAFTISDNSTSDDVEELVRAEFPTLNYVRRRPMNVNHFNVCLEEAQSDYVCIFHDDDLMGKDFIQRVKVAIAHHPESIALATNAIIEVHGQPRKKPSFLAASEYEQIRSANSLAARYFGRHQSGIAPFPAYTYNRKLVGATRFNILGGKYADVTWLLSLARQGTITWIREPSMVYRMHAGNDSNIESRRDRLRFLRFIKQNVAWLGSDILDDYRCSFIYKPIRKNAALANTHKYQTATRFLAAYRWRRYLRASTFRAALWRALVKHTDKP